MNRKNKTFKVQLSGCKERRSSAFTLLEVLLAISIAGTLIAAAAGLMVSVTNIWMERQERHFFEDHVDGVAEFLRASLTSAGAEIAFENSENDASASPDGQEEASVPPEGNQDAALTTTNEGLINASEEPISWSRPPGFADYQDPLLHFKLKNSPPLLVQNDNAPVVGIEAFLHFEKEEGLSLLWYSPLQEASKDLNDLHRTPISDLITKVEYIYWEERFEKWETETEPRESEGEEQFLLPRFLKLTFEYEGVTKERTLTIPVPSKNALIF